MWKTEYVVLISVILSVLGTGRVNKDFSPGIFISKKMVANIKLAFANVPFRHNSYHIAYVIQEWVKFKRVVIAFRLAYIS